MKIAYIFPGQGAQHVGMGKDLYDAFPPARRIFNSAQEITEIPLKRLCFEGPEDRLARTDIAQPAIFTVSAATLAVIDDLLTPQQLESIEPDCAAGLSLGEYTALYAAGAIDFETTLRIVTERGKLMQQAAKEKPSGMLSVLGLDEAAAERLCQSARDGQVLTCANFNCPGQIVLSGESSAILRANEIAKDFGALGSVPLKVAGAFHSKLMASAAEAFAQTLSDVEFDELLLPVLSNIDARTYDGHSEIAPKLVGQLTNPVRWQQCMEAMLSDGVNTFYEIGPGRVLAGLMKRIDRSAKVISLKDRQSLEQFIEQIIPARDLTT